MTRGHLYGVQYSPWTERARWALDHHRVGYRYHEHVPFLGERLLRFRARHIAKGKATAPLFVDEGAALGDSVEIMEHADRRGAGAPLISDNAALHDFRDRIELGLAAGRARVTSRIVNDPEALRESAMAVSPKMFAGLLRPVAEQGARYVARKYGADLGAVPDNEAIMERTLIEIREALGGRDHLCARSGFSAMDIMAATFIQSLAPIGSPYIELGPALTRAWRCERLARDYSDLVDWRDGLYAKFRLVS